MKTSIFRLFSCFTFVLMILSGCAIEKESLPSHSDSVRSSYFVRKRDIRQTRKLLPIEVLMKYTSISEKGILKVTITPDNADSLGVSRTLFLEYLDYLRGINQSR